MYDFIELLKMLISLVATCAVIKPEYGLFWEKTADRTRLNAVIQVVIPAILLVFTLQAISPSRDDNYVDSSKNITTTSASTQKLSTSMSASAPVPADTTASTPHVKAKKTQVKQKETKYDESYKPIKTTRKRSSGYSRGSKGGSSGYIRGKRGGCYYINANGNKTYVDRSLCD